MWYIDRLKKILGNDFELDSLDSHQQLELSGLLHEQVGKYKEKYESEFGRPLTVDAICILLNRYEQFVSDPAKFKKTSDTNDPNTNNLEFFVNNISKMSRKSEYRHLNLIILNTYNLLTPKDKNVFIVSKIFDRLSEEKKTEYSDYILKWIQENASRLMEINLNIGLPVDVKYPFSELLNLKLLIEDQKSSPDESLTRHLFVKFFTIFPEQLTDEIKNELSLSGLKENTLVSETRFMPEFRFPENKPAPSTQAEIIAEKTKAKTDKPKANRKVENLSSPHTSSSSDIATPPETPAQTPRHLRIRELTSSSNTTPPTSPRTTSDTTSPRRGKG